MEELVEKKLIWFPTKQRVETYPTLDSLLAAIEAGDVPKSGKTFLLRPDLPEIEAWVGRRIGFGRPAFKRYKETLKNTNQPISSWLTPKSEADTVIENGNMPIVGTTEEGSNLIREIMGGKAFSYPKPLSLIQSLIEQATDGDDLVMDFFAGSGTTAQAVLELNREDEGKRRFIMVSATEVTEGDPEKNICRDVCAERIRRVINGYAATAGTGGDFAYLRTRRIPHEAVLTDIDHAQVWTAVQLIHRQAFATYDATCQLQESVHADGGLLYAATLNDEIVSRIVGLAADSPHLTVYTWQPGLLRERLAAQNITIEQIPQSLVSRFGVAS
jgi:adenine-specific DNA-methyltransferase